MVGTVGFCWVYPKVGPGSIISDTKGDLALDDTGVRVGVATVGVCGMKLPTRVGVVCTSPEGTMVNRVGTWSPLDGREAVGLSNNGGRAVRGATGNSEVGRPPMGLRRGTEENKGRDDEMFLPGQE